jgi:hypothetical protein
MPKGKQLALGSKVLGMTSPKSQDLNQGSTSYCVLIVIP